MYGGLMRTPIRCFLFGLLLGACGVSQVDDETMYLTGTEESAITLANGQPGCTSPKKVLICHIPPGNPANAHDICVGASAVAPHQAKHGYTIGACSGGGARGSRGSHGT